MKKRPWFGCGRSLPLPACGSETEGMCRARSSALLPRIPVFFLPRIILGSHRPASDISTASGGFRGPAFFLALYRAPPSQVLVPFGDNDQ